MLHKIKEKTKQLKNEHSDELASNIDKTSSDGYMFQAVKALNRKRFENPKVHDNDGKQVSNQSQIQLIIANHFKSKFRDDNIHDVEPYFGQPRKLKSPITEKEVRASINNLKNGRAPVSDNISGEFLKFAPHLIDNKIAKILNQTFERHEDLNINEGLLIALPKPGKPKGPPQNLRPITLLNSIRKMLSTILLNRIRPKIETYISHSQSGFRPNRVRRELRWRLFGHILRRDNSIPANLAMLYYFNENSNRGRGRPTTTLLITLNNDLKRLQNKDVQLTTKEDLHKLQKIASQRQEWIAFTAEIKRTAEAARPDDQASGRH
ncbi:LINE-1 reverse transcriptase homolog [Elysia marginata]|uniref:LINE-1 reverse transcriptase homolog n=1 Tax=Elysia marginata TaxID=1093978 RepID=A0AAV4JX59_9GAST|nr:LINE-1 reverse transcriptase homolog [Elysia marginata]